MCYVSGSPVRFGNSANLSNKQCYRLLKDHMPSHVTENKILQQLYIKYKTKFEAIYMFIHVSYLGIWKEGADFWRTFQDFVLMQVIFTYTANVL